MLVRGPSSLPIHTPPPPRALRRVQTQTDPRYTLSASGLPLALRQTVGPTRFSQIQGPDAPIPFEKCGLAALKGNRKPDRISIVWLKAAEDGWYVAAQLQQLLVEA